MLFMLSQFPHDAAGGAARSLRTACEWAASSGEFRVVGLGTTATDQAGGIDVPAALTELGITVTTESSRRAGSRPLHRYTSRGIDYTLVDTGVHRAHEWEKAHGPQYDDLLYSIIDRHHPDLVVTMGAMPGERERQRILRDPQRCGAIIVLGVRQHKYYHPEAFRHADDALMPSEFLVRRYFERIGIRGTALPMPFDLEDVISPANEREPVFATYINPSLEKGVMFFARLAEELSIRRPDIPFLVVESRATSMSLLQAGNAGGFDLSRHQNIMVSPGVKQPRAIYAATRVLLAPSVWEEPSGRVAAEAMLNGLPPIVSDRGGLPETVGQGGFVVPLPRNLEVAAPRPVEADAVAPWIDVITRLADDAAFYQASCARALEQARAFHPEVLMPRYVEYFRNLRRKQE